MLNAEQLRTFINTLPGWVLLLDHRGQCCLFNQGFAETLQAFPRKTKSEPDHGSFWLQHLEVSDERRKPLDVWQLSQQVNRTGTRWQARVHVTLDEELQMELQQTVDWATLQITPLPALFPEDLLVCVHFQFEDSNEQDLSLQAQQMEQELGLLKRLQVLLAHNVSPEAVFSTVVNAAFEIVEQGRVYVAFLEGEQLRLGPSRGSNPFPQGLSMSDSVAGHALQQAGALLISDAAHAPQGLHLAPGIQSTLGVPFGSHRRPQGVLVLESQQPLTPEDVQVVQTVVHHLNIALETLGLHKKVSEDLRRLKALHEVSQAIHQNRSRQNLLEDIVRIVRDALSVRWSLIFTLQPDGQGVDCAAGAAHDASP